MNKTNELNSYFGGRVLANKSAMKDPAVLAAFQAMQQRNWEELKTPCGGTWNISDRPRSLFFCSSKSFFYYAF